MKNETATWVIISIASLALIGSFGFGGYIGMMNMLYGNYGNGMMFFGWVYGALVLIALMLFIIWLIKQIKK
jgi:uncharacterized membrane protein